ncbi:MAG: hypothetical protein IJ828_10645 [Treponema sp.]|nr:hypothetical protein [Treponema sp.]
MSKPEQIRAFVDSFQSLLNANRKDVDRIKRESRLLSIRYKLTLDLRVSIETEYSDTKTPDVRECYERLFKFLDLWNVYEICMSYGERLGMTSKSHEWNSEFLNEDGIKEFLTAQEGAFKKQFLDSEKNVQEYREYLSHFADLPAICNGNKDKYKKYLSQNAENFDYRQLLFIQYMERNAYYHGGEAARAGIHYSYRKKQLAFFTEFLTQFVAILGARLFVMEKKFLDTKYNTEEIV